MNYLICKIQVAETFEQLFYKLLTAYDTKRRFRFKNTKIIKVRTCQFSTKQLGNKHIN